MLNSLLADRLASVIIGAVDSIASVLIAVDNVPDSSPRNPLPRSHHYSLQAARRLNARKAALRRYRRRNPPSSSSSAPFSFSSSALAALPSPQHRQPCRAPKRKLPRTSKRNNYANVKDFAPTPHPYKTHTHPVASITTKISTPPTGQAVNQPVPPPPSPSIISCLPDPTLRKLRRNLVTPRRVRFAQTVQLVC